MRGEDASRGRILEFWRTVEMFSPPRIEKVDHERKVFRVVDGAALPWESRHRLARVPLDPKLTWRHTVYLGCLSLRQVNEVLAAVYGDDPESYDARLDEETALAALLVDADGIFLEGSPILSTCAWATGQLSAGGSLDRDDFEAAQHEVEQRLTELFTPMTAEGDPAPRPIIDVAALRAARELVADLVGVEGRLDVDEIRVRSVGVSHSRAAETPDDFLNSFLLGDLTHVAKGVRTGRCGSALRSYLSGAKPAHEVDIRKHPEVSIQVTHPRTTPLGRWPSNPAHPLALSQQFAVNQILGGDPATPIYAVNGPPGTGKTTMLRDLIAGIVVRRAEALAELQNPADAFVGKLRMKKGDREFPVNVWRPDLVGHEIVVASSNNGAVENVTLEIPAKKAIDERWLPEIDYFRDLSTATLRAVEKSKRKNDEADPGGEPPEAWALVAAMLGNKDNRNTFASTLWFDGKADDAPPSLQAELRAIGPVDPWPDCVARFRRAVSVVADDRKDKAAASDASRIRDEALRARDDAAGRTHRAALDETDIENRLRGLDAHRAGAEDEVRRRRSARAQHQSFRPNFLASWFDRPALRSWQADDHVHAERVREMEALLHRMYIDHTGLIQELQATRDERVSAAAAHARADRTACQQEAILDDARHRWGDAVPGPEWWIDERRRELAAPWSDPASNAARSEVFLAALRLHRDFLSHQAKAMRENLGAAVDVLQNSAPRELSEDVARAAWQSLFFVAPVVSTTFASVGRMFSHLSADALGWLFVDEAGQATPQSLVGALWRCRRAVVVGDPLQLEPVVTLPFRAQQSLRRAAGVDERWLPARRSAQTVADELMPVGTYLPDGEGGSRWVGAPLRVHRRCDDPMFTVVNHVVYGGMMISAVDRQDAFVLPSGRVMPETKWLHVASTSSERHWVPAEGERLRELLDYLQKQHFKMSEVMVVGPFRDVARGASQIFRNYKGVRGGTVHTAQGKESDVVVLVLGSDPSSSGARRWASLRPNLLNVAVSRARRRLYVIGDRSRWQEQPYFRELAAELPFLE